MILSEKSFSSLKISLIIILCGAAIIFFWLRFVKESPEKIARKYPSETGWMMVCDTEEHTLTVFMQSEDAAPGEWKPIVYNTFPCSTGRAIMENGKYETCTPKGATYIRWKQKTHLFREFKSWYNCWMKGGKFAIHSVLYDRDESIASQKVDGRLGVDSSSGCIRVDLKVAKWIYRTLPVNTPLVVY
jgi:lipoprotein-anchoring transpeptidase ErfK/SrfK